MRELFYYFQFFYYREPGKYLIFNFVAVEKKYILSKRNVQERQYVLADTGFNDLSDIIFADRFKTTNFYRIYVHPSGIESGIDQPTPEN